MFNFNNQRLNGVLCEKKNFSAILWPKREAVEYSGVPPPLLHNAEERSWGGRGDRVFYIFMYIYIYIPYVYIYRYIYTLYI